MSHCQVVGHTISEILGSVSIKVTLEMASSDVDHSKAVYATAGTDEKTQFLESKMGATKAFNYKTQDWAEEISKATDGQGVNLVLDFVGPSYVCIHHALSAMAHGTHSGRAISKLSLEMVVWCP